MKILHSADWHLDPAFTGRSADETRFLSGELAAVPDKIASLCKSEGCDLVLLAGDLFDGTPSRQCVQAVISALEAMAVPVFISPGNHDFCRADSPYLTAVWPKNVHIFTHPVMEAVEVPALDCVIYGAGYEAMDCPNLLKDLTLQEGARWHIGLLHSDPLQSGSPYAPMTTQQVRSSGLSYLALGHIHKGGSFRAGPTFCAWPGCPMGRGFDEIGPKGVLLVSLEDTVTGQFLPLNTPRFFDETVQVGNDPVGALSSLLPPVDTQDFYRVTLVGYSEPVDIPALAKQFPHVPHLELRDRTLPEVDLWSGLGEDTLEGVYFKLLHDAMDTGSEKLQRQLLLAAKLSRQILDGQEVVLP